MKKKTITIDSCDEVNEFLFKLSENYSGDFEDDEEADFEDDDYDIDDDDDDESNDLREDFARSGWSEFFDIDEYYDRSYCRVRD